MMLSATLISNSRLLRDGLPGLLAPYVTLQLVAACAGGLPLCEAPTDPGTVVVVDAGIGVAGVVRWTRYWRTRLAPVHVVAIELPDDTDTVLTCIEAGVGGYTLQGASSRDVAEALSWVQQGIANCTPRVAAELFARFAAAAPPPPPLTSRELEVLRCINQDFSNQEIATALVIEVRTVKHHVHSILQKLKLSHRWEAARVAAERGWLSTAPLHE
jgi:DNA-binding NarL/FixJ family response regulator